MENYQNLLTIWWCNVCDWLKEVWYLLASSLDVGFLLNLPKAFFSKALSLKALSLIALSPWNQAALRSTSLVALPEIFLMLEVHSWRMLAFVSPIFYSCKDEPKCSPEKHWLMSWGKQWHQANSRCNTHSFYPWVSNHSISGRSHLVLQYI